MADYDNDGLPDIYLSNFGANVLYRNQGDGTFRDVAQKSGTAAADPRKVGAGAAFLDIDGDGELDLFVANYLQFAWEKHGTRLWKGVPTYRGPEFYPQCAGMLYANNGDGTFRDVSRESGIAAVPGWGMGVICADYDNDGATDIFVANDGAANQLWKNDGRGHFREVGLAAGIGYDFDGDVHGNIGR
ncbi:MAG: FG-GAP repeat domain-containing protein [Thermoguttaceae bacterium]